MAYRVSELSELFKLVLQECLEVCACQLDDDLFDRNVALLLDQVKIIGNEYGSKIDETTAFQIITAAKNANKRQKFTFGPDKNQTNIHRYQGRTTCFWNNFEGIFPISTYDYLSVKDEEEINSHMLRELSSFVGKMGGNLIEVFGEGFQLQQLILKHSQHLTIENLVKNGIFNNAEIYLEIDNWVLRSKNYSYIEDRFLLDPIVIKGYAHDPRLAQSVPGSKWKNGSLSIYFKWNEKEPTNAEFSFFIPSRTKICFLFDLEFRIKISQKSSLVRNLFSLGITHLLDLYMSPSCFKWTYPRKLEFTIITTSRRLRCLEKIDLHVSQDFLQMEALLINLKYKLKNHDGEEIKRLVSCQAANEALKEDGMDINQEIDVMIEFLKMLDAKNSEIKQNFGYETAETSAFSSFSYSQLRDYLAALKQVDHGDREALIKIIQLKPEMVDKCPTFADLISQNQNMLLGIAFEELMSTKIIATAKKNGILLTRYEGDGFGILPNGKNTPQYSDLVFIDEKGNFHSYQMKFSDNKDSLKEMVSNFFIKHNPKGNLTEIDGLSLENTKVLVPGGFADEIKSIK